jgi:hypothetical protein
MIYSRALLFSAVTLFAAPAFVVEIELIAEFRGRHSD